MTVCGQRPETPGFFTPCRPCVCGQQVVADLADDPDPADLLEEPAR